MRHPVLAAVLLALALAAMVGEPSAEETLTVLGDSLTAGFGVGHEEAFPALVQERLRREGYDYRVVNAGVSGDTTAGGLRRVDWVLRTRPSVVIVALGGNDGLRGLSVAAMRGNLEQIITRIRASGARVLLAGMRVPPNYGPEYARAFAAVFPTVARKAGVSLIPFLLDGVAGDPNLNQADGIHPNAKGQQVVADRLWPYLSPLLQK
jgi:acyl-CoA thioesterase I